MNKVILILDFLILCFCAFILKSIYEVKNSYDQCVEKPIVQEIGYYRCSGSKKNPKYCIIPLDK